MHAGAVIVIALYGLCLVVIWYISPRLPGARDVRPRHWWGHVRLWATFIALTQMVVYALFG